VSNKINATRNSDLVKMTDMLLALKTCQKYNLKFPVVPSLGKLGWGKVEEEEGREGRKEKKGRRGRIRKGGER
jgi:hypothetical protein